MAGCAPKPVEPATQAAKTTEAAGEKSSEKAKTAGGALETQSTEDLPVYFANGGTMNEALAADQWEVGTLSAAAVNSLAIYGAYCIADMGHSEDGLYTLCQPDSPIAKIMGANPSYPDVYGMPSP